MRISILGARGYPSTYGGFETFVRHIAPWLADRGHEVTVYGRSSGRTRHSRHNGVTVVETIGLSGKHTSTLTHGVAAALHCWRDKPDAVLALNIANGPSMPILRLRSIPVLMNVDGIEWERQKWGRVARAGFRLGARVSARFATTLVADSREVARVWRREFGADLQFVPYGATIVEDASTAPLESLGLTPGSYALAVARLVPENNIGLLLDALEIASWRIPAVVVGSATQSNPVEHRLKSLDDAGRIKWLGHIADERLLESLWSHAGVYFHGHSVGGTNPALLQALACGAPTLAIDTPYNREVITNDEQLVPPVSADLSAAIQAVVGNDVLRARWADIGRARIRSAYSWEDVCAQYEGALRAMVDGPQSG